MPTGFNWQLAGHIAALDGSGPRGGKKRDKKKSKAARAARKRNR